MLTAQEYYNQGCLHLENQDFVEAILNFDRAVESNPADYIIYAKRGSAYFALGNYKKAVDDYSKALELNFAFLVGFNNRGVAHRELGNYREAILDFTIAAEWGPDLKSMALSYHNRAITYYMIGDFDEALADLAWAIGFDPNNAIFYSDRGMIKSTQGNLKEGLMDYKLAIAIDPMYANAYTGRAITYIRLKNYQAADNDFTRAVGLAFQRPIHPNELGSLVKNVLTFFYEKFPHPYLAKYVINNYKIGHILSYSNLIYQTQNQCAVIDRYQLYLEKVRGLRQTQAFEFISMQALVHFYMGDPGEAFRLYNDVLDFDFTINLQGQYYFLRSASAFQESEESQRNIRKDATKQADIFFQKFDLTKATANDIKELYYAGQIFFTAEDYLKAHHCFSRIFLQFPAAAYMQVFTLDKLGRTAEMVTKINRIRQWEVSRPVNGFLRGFLTYTLKIDAVDFAVPIHAFALYQELIEAVQLVREEHDESFNAPAFWEAFALSPIDFHQIQHWVLEKELMDLLEEKRTLFSTKYNESEQLGWGADPEAIFKRLQATSSQMEESLVILMGEWRLRTQEYHFYIRYFYFNQSLTLWQTFSLLMYLEKRRLNNRSTPELTKEVGSKTAEEFIKQLLQDPTTYVTAGAFSIAGTTAVAVETTALAGTAIFILLKVLREFTPSESLSGDEAQSEYKQLKINFLERLHDTGEELNLDSKTLFDKFIKPVLEKELKTDV